MSNFYNNLLSKIGHFIKTNKLSLAVECLEELQNYLEDDIEAQKQASQEKPEGR